MLIQFIIILFSAFVIFRLIDKFKKKEVSTKEFCLWLFFWLLVISATIWFRKTDVIAKFFGVEKGADLAVYVSIIVLFYLVFKMVIKFDKMERDITKIVRKIAIDSEEKNKD